MSQVHPTSDRVLVRPIAQPSVSAGGVLLPEISTEKPVKGIVVSTGPGTRLPGGRMSPVRFQTGQTVIYGKYAGTEVVVEGVKHLILRETELLGSCG